MTTPSAPPVVLLTFDGSQASRAAFEPAARLARLLSGELALLRVYQVPANVWVHPEREHRDSEIRKLEEGWDAAVRDVARDLQDGAGVPVRAVSRRLGERWTVTDEILAVADELDPALICMATHGESAVRHLVIGSTAMDVLSRSSRPVALIRAGED
jgi:nucleotide-binding universal stress UspA family protein